jgi:hypothetical protein
MWRVVAPWFVALAAAGFGRQLRDGLPAWWDGRGPESPGAALAAAEDPGHLQGTLRISLLGGHGQDGDPRPRRHLHTFVNGPAYEGMEDNDLRGFLDGTFKYSVNQPSQVHVRIGRRGEAPRYGEHELFRVLMRWADVRLAPEARVHAARLKVDVEAGPARPLRLYLYPVREDWNPGVGGEGGDNASPPRPGEVWWNDRAFGERAWGLPGAGFASDTHPGADTAESPLAATTWRPGEPSLEFGGSLLASYVQERSKARLPLLFLVKLSDFEEDRPGSVLTVYSGNHGDSGNVARRPRLVVEWESPAERGGVETEVFLEYGRVRNLAPLDLEGARSLAASFRPMPGFLRPAVEARFESHAGLSPWRRLDLPLELPAGARRAWLRVIAAPAPLRFGEPFRATIRDTWIVTGPPETQQVRFVFVSPTGARHEQLARYEGDWRFAVEFLPDELGPWRYVWEQRLTEAPFQSAVGGFDVLAEELGDVLGALDAMGRRLDAAGAQVSATEGPALFEQFSRLERAALRFETPEQFRSSEGEAIRQRLDRLRARLGEAPPTPQLFEGLPDQKPATP